MTCRHRTIQKAQSATKADCAALETPFACATVVPKGKRPRKGQPAWRRKTPSWFGAHGLCNDKPRRHRNDHRRSRVEGASANLSACAFPKFRRGHHLNHQFAGLLQNRDGRIDLRHLLIGRFYGDRFLRRGGLLRSPVCVPVIERHRGSAMATIACGSTQLPFASKTHPTLSNHNSRNFFTPQNDAKKAGQPLIEITAKRPQFGDGAGPFAGWLDGLLYLSDARVTTSHRPVPRRRLYRDEPGSASRQSCPSTQPSHSRFGREQRPQQCSVKQRGSLA